jgi:hypothetical protein
MFDSFLIRDGSLQNVEIDGFVIGFKFDVRICDYRGCFLSLHNGYYINVDGEEYPRELQKMEVNGKPPRDFDEIAKAVWEHWFFGDFATIYVQKPLGLSKGKHSIGIKQGILTQYGWQPHDQEWIDNPPDPRNMGFGKQMEIYYYDMEVK